MMTETAQAEYEAYLATLSPDYIEESRDVLITFDSGNTGQAWIEDGHIHYLWMSTSRSEEHSMRLDYEPSESYMYNLLLMWLDHIEASDTE